MKRLFLADVHANLPALEAVLDDVGPVDEAFFLGDIVGCGAHPAECVERLAELAPQAIIGNHDQAILARAADPGHRFARDWDAWTAARLGADQLEHLASLPGSLTVESCGRTTQLIHRSGVDLYLHPAMPDELLARYFAPVDGPAVYCAHSHRAIDRQVNGRRLVCLSSVGQPRDGDPQAGYVLETEAGLEFRRVEYDVEATVAGLGQVGLPPAVLSRWEAFVRQGWDAEWSREYPPGSRPAHAPGTG